MSHLRHQLANLLHRGAVAHQAAKHVVVPHVADITQTLVMFGVNLRLVQRVEHWLITERHRQRGYNHIFYMLRQRWMGLIAEHHNRQALVTSNQFLQQRQHQRRLVVTHQNKLKTITIRRCRAGTLLQPVSSCHADRLLTEELKHHTQIVAKLFAVFNQ